MKCLQNQESFSFNSTSSSKSGVFSNDEEGGYGHSQDRIYSHQQNDYFEISLPPPPKSSLLTKTTVDDLKEEEFEFCSSFNSSSSLVDFPVSTSFHPKPPTTTSSIIAAVRVDNKFRYQNKINKIISNHGSMIRSPRYHPGLILPHVDDQQLTRLGIFDKNQRKLARLGGIRNFMVKLTSIKSMLPEAKSRRLQQLPVERVNQKTSVDCKLKTLDIQRDSSHMATKNNKKRNKLEEKAVTSGFNKMFNVFMKNIGLGGKSKQARSRSCPASIKSSPMHDTDVQNTSDGRRNSFYSRDHSIQAAIAHCKKSFAR